MIRIANLSVPLDADPDDVLALALHKAGIPASEVAAWRLSKRSVDARDRSRVHFVCSLDLELHGDEARAVARAPFKHVTREVPPAAADFTRFRTTNAPSPKPRPIVVGAGPAGLFAALALAEAGRCPIVLERGRPVRERREDVRHFFASGALAPDSNVQFGEGGAGTFSDGKLNTGIRKDRFTRRVFEAFVDAGAPPEILWEARPHIGTDRLTAVVENLHAKICELGGEFLFGHRLVGIEAVRGRLRAIQALGPEGGALRLETTSAFLCIDHSARDTFEMLHAQGIALSPKPFSIGVRIEHPQAMIDERQYGRRFAGHPALGAADYKLALHLPNGRSVYTFCMCPGGTVVAAASEPGGVVTNGMSEFARDRPNANAALLVGLSPADFGDPHPLAGIAFQRRFERAAFALGGGGFQAPVQRVGDFLKGRASTSIGSVQPSYTPGFCPADLTACLPPFASEALRQSLVLLDKKLRGFAHPDAVMTAVETRSSSPVRIERDEAMQSIRLPGLFVCGEGAGYAGGITSSAVDGLRAAWTFLEREAAAFS